MKNNLKFTIDQKLNFKDFLDESNLKLLETDNFFSYLKIIDKISEDIKEYLNNFKNNNDFKDKFQKILKKRLLEQYLLEKRFKKIKSRYLTKDNNSFLKTPQFSQNILERAINKAKLCRDLKIQKCTYDIYNDIGLLKVIYKHYVPKVINFFGLRNCLPVIDSHIRFNDTKYFGKEYLDVFKNGIYDNIHYDEDIFSIPFVIYLSDVKEKDGPFEYLEKSENKRGGPLNSAIQNIISYDSIDEFKINGSSLHIRKLEVLPKELRNSCSYIYHYLYEGEKKPDTYRQVIGPIGTSFMFHGYNLLHGGGLPLDGSRLSLFFNIKFPLKRILNKFSYF